jgi:hypothetical protein
MPFDIHRRYGSTSFLREPQDRLYERFLYLPLTVYSSFPSLCTERGIEGVRFKSGRGEVFIPAVFVKNGGMG